MRSFLDSFMVLKFQMQDAESACLLKAGTICDSLCAVKSAAVPADRVRVHIFACDRDMPGQRFAGLPRGKIRPSGRFPSILTSPYSKMFCHKYS